MKQIPYPRFVYFVRHGESEGNVGVHVQRPDEPLTPRGREQASFVGRRLYDRVGVEHIIASTMTRAQETAQIIAREMKWEKEIEYSSLLVEKIQPSTLLGTERNNAPYLEFQREALARWDDPSWHHSDEENFFDLKARSENALAYIASLPYQHIAVVTHGLFLRMMVGSIVLKDSLSPEISHGLITGMRTQNTGITVAEYNPGNTHKGWVILTFNDYAHLPH